MKIKPEEAQDFKAFEIEVKEVEWQNRCWMMDKYQEYLEQAKNPPFSYYGEVIISLYADNMWFVICIGMLGWHVLPYAYCLRCETYTI